MTASLLLYYSALAYFIGWWLIVRFRRSAAWRARRMSAYHDVQSRIMIEIYGKMNPDYRSVFCLPLVRVQSVAPFAILSIQFKSPYLLWPKADDKMDRRLSLYVELITMFLSRR